MKNPVIMVDSSIIIQSMVESRSPKNKALRQITKRVGKKLQFLGEVTFKHILRENNRIADMQTNLAINHPMGESRIDNVFSQKSIP